MTHARYAKQRYIPAAECIKDGDLTGAITGSAVDVSGYNQMTVFMDITDANDSTTSVDFYLEASPDKGTTWFRFIAGSMSAAGDELLQTHEYTAVPTTNTGKKFAFERPINVRGFQSGWVRLVTEGAATGAGAGDTGGSPYKSWAS